MEKTLPSLRISEKCLTRIESAILKYNKTSLSKLTKSEFRRIALELLAQAILQDRRDILNLSIIE